MAKSWPITAWYETRPRARKPSRYFTKLSQERHAVVGLRVHGDGVLATTDNRKFILIADDEPDAAHLLRLHLMRAGYRTVVARDGLETLHVVFEQKPDLVILDVMMPKMGGLDVCRLIKSNPAVRDTPVLMLTALATLDNKLRGFESGADDYLTKPYEIPEILARVKALLLRVAVAGAPKRVTNL